jgi:hypothetical protein
MFDSQRAAQKSWCCHSHLRFARSRWLSLARSPCQVKQGRNWLETSRNCLEQEWTSKESARTQSIYKNVQGVANHSNKIQSLKKRIKNMGHVTCASVWDCASQSARARKLWIWLNRGKWQKKCRSRTTHGNSIPWPRGKGAGSEVKLATCLKGESTLKLHVFTLKFGSFGKFLPSSNLGIGWWTSEFDFGYERLSRPTARMLVKWVSNAFTYPCLVPADYWFHSLSCLL